MKKDETLIQDKIIEYLNERKILHWRISGASNMAGFPDILVCYLGQFIGIEVKTPTGKATLQQLKTIEDIRVGGGIAFLATSVCDVENLLGIRDYND